MRLRRSRVLKGPLAPPGLRVIPAQLAPKVQKETKVIMGVLVQPVLPEAQVQLAQRATKGIKAHLVLLEPLAHRAQEDLMALKVLPD